MEDQCEIPIDLCKLLFKKCDWMSLRILILSKVHIMETITILETIFLKYYPNANFPILWKSIYVNFMT